MHYHDSIYGSVQIGEPVLQALFSSNAMQRLQGVMQHGISGVIGLTPPITRFEHSVGVLLLVRRLGGSLEEQIAALLHDVSHTAFSHVIDYVFGGHDSQSYHDEVKEEVMAQSDLPAILQQYGFDWRRFLDDEAFPLLEQPSPRLCADRLDYFLRDSIALGLAHQQEVDMALGSLTICEGRVATNDLEVARWLAYTYIEADKASWANLREVALYELTARAMRRALEIDLITTMDLWKTDAELWHLLCASSDPLVSSHLSLVNLKTQVTWDAAAPTFWVSTKLRSIDPDVCLNRGQMTPLSVLDEAFRDDRQAYHRDRAGRWPIKVVGE